MSEIMEMYEKIAAETAVKEERLMAIHNLILKKGCTKEEILDLDYTEEEYRKAKETLLKSI